MHFIHLLRFFFIQMSCRRYFRVGLSMKTSQRRNRTTTKTIRSVRNKTTPPYRHHVTQHENKRGEFEVDPTDTHLPRNMRWRSSFTLHRHQVLWLKKQVLLQISKETAQLLRKLSDPTVGTDLCIDIKAAEVDVRNPPKQTVVMRGRLKTEVLRPRNMGGEGTIQNSGKLIPLLVKIVCHMTTMHSLMIMNSKFFQQPIHTEVMNLLAIIGQIDITITTAARSLPNTSYHVIMTLVPMRDSFRR